MYLIVGLGNPGPQYENNRHNVGFMVIDAIAKHYAFPDFTQKYNGLFSQGVIDGKKTFLLKPQTFMNLSGKSLAKIVPFFKIPLNQVVVIHDELDLKPGKTRVKKGGGAGGHNGLKSIDGLIGKEYKRVRVGIGHPGHKDLVHSYVLNNFQKEDQSWLPMTIGRISENIELLMNDEDSLFMTKIAESM